MTLALLLPILLLTTTSPVAPAPVWRRDAADPRWVIGRVELGAPPDQVWARLSQLERWGELFSDVRSVRVLEHDGPRWRLQIDTWLMKSCGPHEYRVEVEGRSLRVEIVATGLRAHLRMEVLEGAIAGRSAVTYALFIDPKGVVGALLPKKRLRNVQESMVSTYLSDIGRRFTLQGGGSP